MSDPCWLCEGLGGIAVHQSWTKRRRTERPDAPALWTPHALVSDSHPVRPCPACQSALRSDIPKELGVGSIHQEIEEGTE